MSARRSTLRLALLPVTLLTVFALGPLDAAARSNPVEGSWRGNGRAVAKDGKSYRVRCKFRVYRIADKRFQISGKCSSTKGTTAGAADLKQVGARSFRGSGSGLSGTGKGRISLSVKGKSMSLSVRGNKGRMSVRLRKQGN